MDAIDNLVTETIVELRKEGYKHENIEYVMAKLYAAYDIGKDEQSQE